MHLYNNDLFRFEMILALRWINPTQLKKIEYYAEFI